ncbi:MAG: hypothetical protein C0467_15880 [Planctomycetaceae bacterium]|nr:hypothetical protein [Planctomycetaceae bacterium]
MSLDEEPAPQTQNAVEKWASAAGKWVNSVEERVERKCGPRYGKEMVKIGRAFFYTFGVILLLVMCVNFWPFSSRTYTKDQLIEQFRMEPMESIESYFGRATDIRITQSGEIVMLNYEAGRIKIKTPGGSPASVVFIGRGGRCAYIDLR